MRRSRLKNFSGDESGAILVEALMVIPVITLFAFGVMEFGNIFWQRLQLENGVRDAARYWSRCRPSYQYCKVTIAQNIAFYGNPAGAGAGAGSGGVRVPGWDGDDPADLTIIPLTPPLSPNDDDIVEVTGTTDYAATPLFDFLGVPPITLQYTHKERYIGW